MICSTLVVIPLLYPVVYISPLQYFGSTEIRDKLRTWKYAGANVSFVKDFAEREQFGNPDHRHEHSFLSQRIDGTNFVNDVFRWAKRFSCVTYHKQSESGIFSPCTSPREHNDANLTAGLGPGPREGRW